ncbi:MAG: SHOCT domain-containing protein [Gemmataceae bacterium]
MSLADELQKLEGLRVSGVLTDEEFEKAKARLLDGPSPESNQELEGYFADQLAEVKYQNRLTQIDREWEIERENYLIAGRYGRTYVPTTGIGVGMTVLGGGFGIFWTIMAISITGSVSNDGAFAIAQVIFPLIGVLFTVGAVVFGVRTFAKAQKYQQAYAAYQVRRANVKFGEDPSSPS